MKHTQGSWHYGPFSGSGKGFWIHGNKPASEKSMFPFRVADLNIYDKNPVEVEANAKLIASAPDLLEACKFAFENLRPKGNVKKDFSGHNAMATLSRAIKRATE